MKTGMVIIMEKHKILYKSGVGEYEEKKSRFIATTCPVENEEEALAFIERMKKKYWDARHNCSAYILGERSEIMRCSDDGEPSQTAGRPMLDVIQGAGVTNVAVVVTRYFGGVLLGTGGLVRAYSKATADGLANSVVVEKIPAKLITLGTDYNGMGKLQYIAGSLGLTTLDTKYTDVVEMDMLVPLEDVGMFISKVTDATSGKCKITEQGECYYGLADGEVVVF